MGKPLTEARGDVQEGIDCAFYTAGEGRRLFGQTTPGPTIGAEVHLPFGGVKQTGNGHREAGTTTMDVFTEWKSVYVDFSGSLQRAQIDNRS